MKYLLFIESNINIVEVENGLRIGKKTTPTLNIIDLICKHFFITQQMGHMCYHIHRIICIKQSSE